MARLTDFQPPVGRVVNPHPRTLPRHEPSSWLLVWVFAGCIVTLSGGLFLWSAARDILSSFDSSDREEREAIVRKDVTHVSNLRAR